MQPESTQGSAAPFVAVLERVRRRIAFRHLFRAVAIAAIAAGSINFVLGLGGIRGPWRIGGVAVVFVASAFAFLRWSHHERTTRSAAAAIENADPSLRNLAITAAQLLQSTGAIRPYIRERVFSEVSARTAAMNPRRAVPLSREAILLAAAVTSAILLALVPLPAASNVGLPVSSAGEGSATGNSADLVVELTPPSYTGRTASRLVNPAALDVLGGTAAIVRVPAGPGARIRVNGAQVPLLDDGAARVIFSESGFLAIDSGKMQRLLPLTVTPDAAPAVRITAPAKDLRVPSNAVTVPIAASADDDLGLASFDVRYTVVSGSGEQFTFTEGTVPAALQRTNDRSWRLDARLALNTLKLEPGDALIYRAVAADRRPGGAGVASSDTFFVEIAGPGDVPLEGVEMPPERERYALSQAMIVLKLERLQARERALAAAALAEEAGNIAAEQRAVRANFVFLLGGEVEDEEEEAEHSHEISEGRFANQARRDIVTATVLMGQVEKALAAISTREALPPARAAVKALQRAFGHSRYLLRALPSRVRIDPARRLSGDTASATNWDRALSPAPGDPVTASARAALADLIAVSSALQKGVRPGSDPWNGLPAAVTETLRDLGERVLSAAAQAQDLQPAAKEIAAARDALAVGDTNAAREALRRAAGPLVKRAQQGRIDRDSVPRDAARLAGAAAIGRGGSK